MSTVAPAKGFQRVQPWVELSRIQKFAGTMLVFWPYAWSLGMIARKVHLQLPDFFLLLLQGFAGAILLHRYNSGSYIHLGGPGCVWNDILDRDLDRKVERTKHRPIADGRISVPGALVFLLFHLILLVSLIWKGNPVVWRLGLAGIFVLPGFYPLMKRITYWPQAYLGFAVNIGVPLASAALEKNFSRSTTVLSVAAWTWTLWYDTIYGCQDMEDDVKAGVKSTAVLLGGKGIKWLLFLFGSVIMSCFAACGVLNRAGWPYWVITVGGGAFLFAKELWQVDLRVPKSCLRTFNRNGFVTGSVMWTGVLLDYLLSLYAQRATA